LIVAAAGFHDPNGNSLLSSGDLFAAHALIRERVGNAPAFLFALGLLCAGQAASVTVTLSGQVIAEGMLNWRTRPWIRRIITRLIGLVPALAVSLSAGREAIDSLLVGSQVALSIVLPFVIFPCVFSGQAKMT
jgi:metal iron transporter